MMSDQRHDWLLAFTRGDRAAGDALRERLRAIRAQAEDPRVRAMIDEVLQGRRSVRELAREPAFGDVLVDGFSQFGAQWSRMSSAQRAELAEQGRLQMAERRLWHAEPVVDDQPIREMPAVHATRV